jgi:hypothetical protein
MLSIMPPPDDSGTGLCLSPASLLLSGAAAAENIDEKGEPILDITELEERRRQTQASLRRCGITYPTEDMRDESGGGGGGRADDGSGACGGGGVRKSGLVPLASKGCLVDGTKLRGRTTLSLAGPSLASAALAPALTSGNRRLLRWKSCDPGAEEGGGGSRAEVCLEFRGWVTG